MQRGPLSHLFAKQKSFWERPATASLFSAIGMSDHVTASDSAAAIPRPVKQLEATVQRLRMTRVVSSDDDFRRLSLSRFKTMVLLEVDATRLGLSLLTFAGTLCSNEELGQIFNDVFCTKIFWYNSQALQFHVEVFMLAANQVSGVPVQPERGNCVRLHLPPPRFRGWGNNASPIC